MEDEIESVSGIAPIAPVSAPFAGNAPQRPPNTNPDRFLDSEPAFYSSQDIAQIFFSEAKVETFWPQRNMAVINETSTKIPYSEFLAQEARKKAAAQRASTAAPVIFDGINNVEVKFPTVEITAKGYRKLPFFKVFISKDGDKLNYLADHPIYGKPAASEV